MAARIRIIIVNYRTADLTIGCMRSLAPELGAMRDARVMIVDNASGDDSVDRIGAAIDELSLQDSVSVLSRDRNGGFAYGNNEAIRQLNRSPYDYVLLLNPDTIVRSGAIGALVSFMDEHPAVGIAGSRLEDPDGTAQRSAFQFHSILSEFESGIRIGAISRLLSRWVVAPPAPDLACKTDWISGASMIIRRNVLDSIGLLDEGYFMYFEEVDFCRRAKRAGFECWYVPQSRIVHLIGKASGVDSPSIGPTRRPVYWFESRRRYFVKNHGWLYAALADLAFAIGYAIWRLRRLIQRKPDRDPPRLLRDFLVHSALVARVR
jgi:hypothetical protein